MPVYGQSVKAHLANALRWSAARPSSRAENGLPSGNPKNVPAIQRDRETGIRAMGRQTLEQKLAAVELKANRLRHQLSEAKRKADARRKIVVGGTVLAAIESDRRLRATVIDLLRQNVTRPLDLETVTDLLGRDAAPSMETHAAATNQHPAE